MYEDYGMVCYNYLVIDMILALPCANNSFGYILDLYLTLSK